MTPEMQPKQPVQPELPNIPAPTMGTPSVFDQIVENEKNSTDVVTQTDEVAEEPRALAAFSTNVQFDTSDIAIPRIRLAQALTAEVTQELAKAGQFVMTGMEPQDSLTVVPIMFARRRMLMNSTTQEVLCRSTDSLVGVGVPGGVCSDCELSKWTGTDEQKDRKPPVCTFMYTYLVFVVEWETLAILDFRKTSTLAGKVVNTLAASRGLGKFAVGLKALKQMNSNRQTFFVMSVTPAKVDEAVLDTARQFASGGGVL